MYKFETFKNEYLDEEISKIVLKNGLEVYICSKKGYNKKIGLFGTKYGSIINDFVDIKTNERIKVPDGIAHFLEHKLFEQEGANALDLFAKIGVSSNAYTSFDQTVYYFETIERFKESVELLIKLVKTPYFTDENVNKEQGIIAQEISMYDDNPMFNVYFNALRAIYNTHPIRIDVAGTIESIQSINKDLLYTCYNTFYNPSNMFFIVIGDVDKEETIKLIEDNIKIYEKDYDNAKVKDITKYFEEEKDSVQEKIIKKEMDIYMSQLCIGYKLPVVKGNEIVKRQVIADFISEMFFSKLTNFFKEQYELGLIYEPINFEYEGSDSFAHVLLSAGSMDIEILKNNILNYINNIKNSNIDEEMFNIIKKMKIGESILSSENLNNSYRRIIDSIVDNITLYEDVSLLNSITKEDIKEFLNNLKEETQVISIITNIK